MTDDQELYDAIYKACLTAARIMGDDLKKMSWFYSNWRVPRK